MSYFLLIFIVAVFVFILVQQARRIKTIVRQKEVGDRQVWRDAIRERDQLLDALGDAFLLVNDISQITFANAVARRLVKGRKLSGRSVIEAFLDDQLSVAIMKCIRTGKPMQEKVILHSTLTPLGANSQEGVSAWVIDAAPLESMSDEKLTRVVIRDVTKEYLAEQVRRDFVANASHELRTPMAIINGYLENLLDDGLVEDADVSRQFLGTMRKHGQRVERLVEDMLVISKMESGEVAALNKEDFILKDCVCDVLDRLSSMIDKQGVVITTVVMPDDLWVHADRFYLTQILFNLIENALKQNVTSQLEIGIEAREENERVALSVTDNGVGIPSADLPYIFKRFYRVDKHHTESQVRGTGLGLSIVKRAVEAHGGEISAESIPGQRTCFTIILPQRIDSERV